MTAEKTDGRLLTPLQVAEMLNVTTGVLAYWRRLHRPARIPFVKIGRRCVRYRKADVEAFINRQTVIDGEAK